MSATPIAILKTGLVTSVGLTAPATCAAVRAKLTNPSETRFINSNGDWIIAHQVTMDQPWRGLTKLTKMAAMVIEEALDGIARDEWPDIPLLLCVAEPERPGRLDGVDGRLFLDIQTELSTQFSAQSSVVPHGHVGVAVAMAQARALLGQGKFGQILIVAADSFVSWPTLSHYEREGRLLTASNSNGFMPGEGAGALLVGAASGGAGELLCTGIGFACEVAHIDSGEPLRAEGLSQAIKSCMHDAGCQMDDMDFRITDLSGEQYYFKEAALALSRTMRKLKNEFDIWHPAECIGEVGAVAGIAVIANAHAACTKNYTKGPNVLTHWANDIGQRAALSLHFRVAA
jgi:3-oxoacyl-[acyl-carrier-protein] synthase I